MSISISGGISISIGGYFQLHFQRKFRFLYDKKDAFCIILSRKVSFRDPHLRGAVHKWTLLYKIVEVNSSSVNQRRFCLMRQLAAQSI